MPEALPELVWFAVVLFCFAFVWTSRKLLTALFGGIASLVGHIPFVGGAVSDAVHSTNQAVANALGSVESGLDSLIGASFHRLAELNLWLWREFKRHAGLLNIVADEIRLLSFAYAHLHGLAHRALAFAESIPHRLHQVERKYYGIEHRVRTVERTIEHGIGHDVLPRIKSLDHELSHLEEKVIPSIRAAERDAAAAISDLYAWARGKASLLGVGTFTLAVATALTALGLGWLRCSSNPFTKSKNPCGLWSVLEKVLGLAGLLAVGFNFQEFVDAASEVAGGIGTFVGDLEAPFVAPLPPLPPPQG